MKYWRRYLFISSSLLLSLGVFYLACCWYFSEQILKPAYDAGALAQIQRLEVRDDIQRIQLPSPAGGVIDAWYIRSDNSAPCVLIYNHGWGEQRLQSDKFQPAFADFNCAQLRYDMRGHGRRYGESVGGGQLEKLELLSLHQWLQEQHGYSEQQIGWFGLSWGAATVLQAAALNAQPAFVVADSPFQDWQSAIFERGARQYGSWVHWFRSGVNLVLQLRAGVRLERADTRAAAAFIQAPVLLIHSQSDAATDSQQSVNIAAAMKQAHQFEHTNWGAAHGDDITVQPEAYRQIVYTFINKYASGFGQKNDG
ncbi:alpha/beta hydrolase [Agaribacterium haliotis]|uniref:alpha/beta hydrolase n=1 Tax=Agaribacterium haliotis TaxID=2013869 RepID=UPI000BB57577|nr:CocE/NonD family hydrolase [Agaribacterium haliotis]